MRKSKSLLLLLILLIPKSTTLQAQDIIEVSIKGISDGIRNSTRQDRDEAIMDAKLQAVEKAGVNIKSVTEVENYMLKKDWIQSKAEAYLMPGFQIINIGYGEDNLYRVVLIGKIRTITYKPTTKQSTKPSFETVKIGSQVWMAKNLNVTTFRNGDRIPEAYTNEEWEKAGEKGEPVWCYYNNDPENGEKYGKLYNWFAVNDHRGLAPAGWHIPSDGEWQRLVDFLGSESFAGAKLKSSYGWKNNGNGSNSSDFSALPGGCRIHNGTFFDMGGSTYFWSSTEDSTYYAWYRALSYYSSEVIRYHHTKRLGFSVRLVRD